MKNPHRYLSATQAAKVLHLDRSRIKVLCSQERIRGAIKVGRHWAIPAPPLILPPKPGLRAEKTKRILRKGGPP